MFIIFGEKSYGKIDRVPGVCYVITMFAHLNFLPLLPLRSYVVIEGTENGSEFRGKEISLSLKSALAGYVRVWFGAAVLVCGGIAGFGLNEVGGALRVNALATVGLFVAGAAGVFALFAGGKFGVAAQFAFHIVSALVWLAFANAAGPNARAGDRIEGPLLALLAANVALLLYGLTRFMDYASAARKRELFEQLGVELPAEDEEEREHRQNKWEGWEEGEGSRKRG